MAEKVPGGSGKPSASGGGKPGAGKTADGRPDTKANSGAITAENVQRFLDTFERSARRWEMVVYPAMFAFILLAGYGFFLIYSLTNDMRVIATNLDPNMGVHMTRLTDDMEALTENIRAMTENVTNMAGNIEAMTDKIAAMSQDTGHMSVKMNHLAAMDNIVVQMTAMNQAIAAMTANMDLLRRDMTLMSRNVAKPMSMMNSFFPW